MLAVIGCGDPNRQDDGFGSAVITRLIELTAAQYDRRAKLLDAGLDGMGVLFYAKGAKALILIDAHRSGAAPGSIVEVSARDVAQAHQRGGGGRDFRWDHALHAGKNIHGENFPEDVTVYLVEAEIQGNGLDLTPAVAAAVEPLARRIQAQIAGYCAREDAHV